MHATQAAKPSTDGEVGKSHTGEIRGDSSPCARELRLTDTQPHTTRLPRFPASRPIQGSPQGLCTPHIWGSRVPVGRLVDAPRGLGISEMMPGHSVGSRVRVTRATWRVDPRLQLLCEWTLQRGHHAGRAMSRARRTCSSGSGLLTASHQLLRSGWVCVATSLHSTKCERLARPWAAAAVT